MSDSWYAASIVMAVLVEGHGLVRRVTSVVLVRAATFEAAFHSAIAHGQSQEEVYENVEGEAVRWALERVATLDQLPAQLIDGTEIYSEIGEDVSDVSVPFDSQFDPYATPPNQTGVSST